MKRKITKHVNLDALREQLTKSVFCTKLQSMLQEDTHTDNLEGMAEQMYSTLWVPAADTLPKICNQTTHEQPLKHCV